MKSEFREEEPFLARIRTSLPKLHRAERQLATFLLDFPGELAAYDAQELARLSGGRIFEADTTYNLDAAFRSIAEELRRQYSLGYYPENTGTRGDRKRIRVRVRGQNLVVRTKRSYIVGN